MKKGRLCLPRHDQAGFYKYHGRRVERKIRYQLFGLHQNSSCAQQTTWGVQERNWLVGGKGREWSNSRG